jgi:hypothetical protein
MRGKLASCQAAGKGEDAVMDRNRPTANRHPLAVGVCRWGGSLMLTALIVFGALLFGSQLTDLWRPLPDLQPTAAIPLPVMADPADPLELNFGNTPHTIFRQQVTGGMEEAMKQLRTACLRATATAAGPSEPPGLAEQELLKKLPSRSAVPANEPGIDVHQVSDQLPFLVGLRRDLSDHQGNPISEKAAARVVAWALATPAGDASWNLYVFSGQQSAGGTAEQEIEVAVPPTGKSLLRIKAANGSLMLTFLSTGDLGKQTMFYDDYYAQRQWQRVSDWRTTPLCGTARYRKAVDGKIETADVQIQRKQQVTEDAGSCWWGIVNYVAHTEPR